MKFYNPDEECVGEMNEVGDGRWATREDVGQLERERDQWKAEAERRTKLVDALTKDYSWKQDAVKMAKMVKNKVVDMLLTDTTKTNAECFRLAEVHPDLVEAQTIIDRYEGGKG